MPALKIVFMGSPDFSVPSLQALIGAGHEIACVYAQPPRKAGRGHKVTPCPAHAFALGKGLDVRTPPNFKDPADVAAFRALDADAAVVAAYGLILPKAVLEAPRLGCMNIHASLLPRWRGAAPIQRAIEAGDTESGVTIMRMDEGLDTGAMLMAAKHPITPETTGGGLHDGLSALGARMIVTALERAAEGACAAAPQPDDGVTHARKIAKDEARLDFTRPAPELERRIRAFTPWPGTFFEYDGERIKVLSAVCEDGEGETPGVVLQGGGRIHCGQGVLRLVEVQKAGGGRMTIQAFLRGNKLAEGARL